MFNARRQIIFFIKRFYLLGLFVVFVVFAVLASGIYSKKSRIEQDLKSQSEIAVNLMKHHNDDLLSELDDIQNSIALTSKPLEVMNSKMDKKGEFNAIFYLKNAIKFYCFRGALISWTLVWPKKILKGCSYFMVYVHL